MGKKKNVTTAASSFVDENSATFSKNVDVPCEGAPEASATALPAAHPPFSVLISELIHEMRLRNGLRHHDALRYRHYCSKRLHRVRSKLHYKQGRGRYVHHPFPFEFSDVRYVYILLLLAERSWASSVHAKTLLESSQATRFRVSHLRHFLRRRLRKAVLYGKQLLDVCQRHGDKVSVLEAKAYRAWLSGSLATERRQLTSAAEDLMTAKQYYMQLERLASGERIRVAAIAAQLTSIGTNLRTVSYYLARQGVDVNSFFRLEEPTTDTTASTSAHVRPQQPRAFVELTWRGATVPVAQALVESSECLNIEQSIRDTLVPFLSKTLHADSTSGTYSSVDWNSVLQTFKQVQSVVERSATLIHESLLNATDDEDQGSTTSSQQQSQNHTHLFVLESVIRDWSKLLNLEMHICLFHIIFTSYRCAGFPTDDRGCSRPSSTAPAYAPSFVVCLADITLQLLATLKTEIAEAWLPPSLESAVKATVPMIKERLELWTGCVRDMRAAALCLVLRNSQKCADAYVLAERLVERRNDFMTHHDTDDFTFPDTPHWQRSPFFRVAQRLVDVNQLLSLCLPQLKLTLAADLLMTNSSFLSAAEPEAKESRTGSTALQDVLHQLTQALPGVDVPQLEPLPMKPIFFDLASTRIEPPDVTHLCFEDRQEDKAHMPSSGLVGRLASWWKR